MMISRIVAVAIVLLGVCVSSAHAAREYRIVLGHDIQGFDIPSDGKPYTKVCTGSAGYKGKFGFDAFKLACDDNPKCVAATAPTTPDGCAYLKSKGTRDVIKPDEKFVVVTSAEKPQKPCTTFSPIGGQCTSDPWVDQPICCGGNRIKCVNNKCGNGMGTSGTPSSGPREYRIVPGHDIQGFDIPSDGKPYTKVCTGSAGYKGKFGFEAYQLACDDNPKCVAATAPTEPDGCAYLKSKGTRDVIKPDEKFAVVTSAEKPQKPCTFSPLGGQCTTDPWVDQPVCCGGNHNPCKDGKCVSGFPSGRRLV